MRIFSYQSLIQSTTRYARLILVCGVIVIVAAMFREEILNFFGIGRVDASIQYSMQTGYFVGDGASKSISGLGFSPEVVIIKADTTAGVGAIMKTTAMPQNNVAYLGVATADNTASQIQLTDDGFIVTGALSNSINARHTWVAFSGSDCSASGQLCVGGYTGDGTANKSVPTGFDPDLVIVKQSTAVAGNWRSSAMPDNFGQYFMALAEDTTGALFTTLDTGGFTVGSTNNASGGAYYFVAFPEVAGGIDVGSYVGDGVDNRSIAGVGFTPDWVFTKQTGAIGAVYNLNESYGDSSSYFTDTANLVNAIQVLQADGFQVGTSDRVNADTVQYYYAAFGGAVDPAGAGTFSSVSGTYIGNGNAQVLGNLGFSPDLVIVTASGTEHAVFTTRVMGGDSTAYFGNSAVNFAGGITTLSPTGFTVGSHSTVNTEGVEYHWTAYGNAWNPETNSGASDFVIGAYYGNAIDGRAISRLPFSPDMLVVKRQGVTEGVWRTSEHVGDSSSFFHEAGEATGRIKNFTADGFEVGVLPDVNTNANLYWYFAFATGSNFSVGTYSGTGVAQNISTPFQPDQAWVKHTGTTQGVMRSRTVSDASSYPFINTGSVQSAIESFYANGFSVGVVNEVNAVGADNYRYAVWQDTATQGTATYAIQTGYYVGDGGAKEISGLGFAPEVVIIKADTTAGVGAIMKTTAMPQNNVAYLGVATADNTAGAITLTSDGFRLAGTLSNTVNSRHTWVAFSGSDCSASGQLCVGGYTGDGTANKSVPTGFDPDLVIVKQSTAVAGNWRSSAMPDNFGQYFMALAEDTTGALFTTLDTGGFTVGSTNNASGGAYYFVAFPEVAGGIDVGSYVGNATVGRSITGFGMRPDFVLLKNSNSNVSAVYTLNEAYGNSTSLFTDTANIVNSIMRLESDGIQVGTHATAHENGSTHYYASFSGVAPLSASGSYVMNSGSYVGTGDKKVFSDLGFSPDLVIIKGESTQAGVFSTTMMGGDSTAYLDSAGANFAGGITALLPDSFTIGTNASVNSAGVTYHWVAFGNAWNPDTNSGAEDLMIGAYYGNSADNRNITRLPFQPDMVSVKRNGATGGVWRSAEHIGDSSSFFSATADGANRIQSINSDGFQIGTNVEVNTNASTYWYFAFATSTKLSIGAYSGTGSAQEISIGMQPHYLWVKHTGATRGIERFAGIIDDGALPFISGSIVSGAITNVTYDGFSLGIAPETNAVGVNNYHYVVWKESLLQQTHYHWRANDGNEQGASSLTGGVEDTPLSDVREGLPYRLRVGVANEGGVRADVTSLRLEYGEKTTSCNAITSWKRITETGSAWGMYNSSFLTEGEHTTNIPKGDGGVSDGNTVFITANGGVRDESDETGPLQIKRDEFVELEYSLTPTEYAMDSSTYCFRVTDAGSQLSLYSTYPEATFAVHMTVSATGTQEAQLLAPSVNEYIGGAIVLKDISGPGTHSITEITLTESGTVDASGGLENISLYYEYDTSAPYDCSSESFDGNEAQYGQTVATFSGPDGTATFSGSVTASTTQAVCLYPVLSVTNSALSNETIDLGIATADDVVVAGSERVRIDAPVTIDGVTVLVAPLLEQTHYHWRNDDGTESTASSATGGNEDTPLENLSKNTPRRIRVQVSNEGLATSSATTFRLEYALRNGTCEATGSGWTDVAQPGGAWGMYNTPNLSEGAHTTNIAVSSGGVTDENTTFLSVNGGVRDTTSEVGPLALAPDEFVEFEYAVTALIDAQDGENYCFRVTDQGVELPRYTSYPDVSLSSDIVVSALGSHKSTLRAGVSDVYVGGSWVLRDQSSSRAVTSITLTEQGTVDAQTGLTNIRLYYDVDTSAPYDCSSEIFDGNEAQYGQTVATFSGPDGIATFSGSVIASTTASICLYVVFDVDGGIPNGDTVLLSIANPSTDVVVSTGTVNPNNPVAPSGESAVVRAVLSQEHYHFRNDDGDEASATSRTNGIEDTPLSAVRPTEVQRLRIAVTNTGSTSTDPTTFTLEYAEQVSTCSASGGWQAVGSPGALWSPSDSDYLADGEDTTNISAFFGGVSDKASTFLTPNSGVIEGRAVSGELTLPADSYVELEYVIEANGDVDVGTTYCFRLFADGNSIDTYATYPETGTVPLRDFLIQRGVVDIDNGTSTVSLVAGIDYTAPRASTSAFVRITNSSYTGAGNTSGGGTQNADRVTTSILNPWDIEKNVTFVRSGLVNPTRIYWEIIEYIGPEGGDNEIVVRHQDRVTYDPNNTEVSTGAVGGIQNDSDVVVFITGQQSPSASSLYYYNVLSTAQWNAGSDTVTFLRGGADNIATIVSYAVVEFKGANWKIQRSEHTHVNAGAIETESITPVNALSRTFLHTQKRVGEVQVDEFGHLVWLSGVGQVSYAVPSTASSLNTHVSVAWVIENTQTNGSPMVVTRSGATISAGGPEPSTFAVAIGATLSATNNASIFMNMWGLGNTTAHPRAIMGAGITSTTFYELWISDTGSAREYRTEIVDWPTAEMMLSQNYYRWYVNNNDLTPSDPWPVGVVDLGENTAITGFDDPPLDGDILRLRMSVLFRGTNVSQGTKQFMLQYGERKTTCGAITEWFVTGDSASTTALWRGYNATPLDGTALSTNPPTFGDLKISLSDRAGTFEEANPTAPNPYKIFAGDDVEYDWILQANDARDYTGYCFRMVLSDGTELDEYTYYPTLTTAGFELQTEDWRWYDDETSLTPSTPLAGTSTAPVNVPHGEALKLRVVVGEKAGRDGENVKLRLQWSEYSDFSVYEDVDDMDMCTTGSRWCYFDGAGNEGAIITDSVLTTADMCVGGVGDGCGTHNKFSYAQEVVGEVGTVTADSGGTFVTLQHTYNDPVFIVEAISGDAAGGSENRPAVAVITATSTSNFTVRIQEPDSELDNHGSEIVSYIVMERGAYLLPDGRRVDVNTIDTGAYFGSAVIGSSDDTCSFTQSFSTSPVVLASLQTNNNNSAPDFLTASVHSVTGDDFACALEMPRGESNAPSTSETLGWIAIEGGAFSNNTIFFEVSTTTTSVTGWADTPWFNQLFTQDFSTVPNIVATKQTRNGIEGGWVRYDNMGTDSVQFAIDGGERTRTDAEGVGYLAFSEGGVMYGVGVSDFFFERNTKKEFEFTLTHYDALPNVTYFFRLYDVSRNEVVSTSTTSTLPSLSTEGASLQFSIAGIPDGTFTEGVITDVFTTATSVPFGSLPLGVDVNAGQKLIVTTNALNGYQVLAFERQNLLSSGGAVIQDISGSNSAPVAWTNGCLPSALSCYGYHVGDDTLAGGSTRFFLDDTFAPFTSTFAEVAYNSGPVIDEVTDIIYRIRINYGQPAGTYESKVGFVVVPVF